MVFAFLQKVLVSAAFVALGTACAARLGVAAAIGVVAALAALASLLGALLLRTSAVGTLTWRNVAAGWLLPWGFVLGGGRLPRIATMSAACLAVMGAIGALAGPSHLVAAAWTVDAVALLALLRPFGMQAGNPSARRQLLRPMLAVLGLALAGGLLLFDGRPGAAALVAGGPLVVGGVIYGSWVVFMLTAGRKGRWN
jgi:hypothetical protein